MGTAVRKPAPEVGNTLNPYTCPPLYSENVVHPSFPDSPALLVSVDMISDHHEDQHQHQHEQLRPPPTSSKLRPSLSGALVDASSGLANPPSPPSPGNLSLVGEDCPPRHAAQRLTRSSCIAVLTDSSLPNELNLDLNSPQEVSSATSTGTSATRAPGALAAVLPAAAPPSPSPSLLNSPCSIFSLYSAESSSQELPPLPAQLQTKESATRNIAMQVFPEPFPLSSLAPRETHALTGSHPATATAEAAPASSSSGLCSRTEASLPAASTNINSFLFTAAHCALTAAPPPHPLSAGPSVLFPTKPQSSALAQFVVSQSCSRYLMDMSFDSRSLTTDAVTTSAEIHRIGNYLQKCHLSPSPSASKQINPAGARSNPSLVDSSLISSAAFSSTELLLKKSTLPQHNSLTAPPSLTAVDAASGEHHNGSTTQALFFAETEKFVQVIQQLQRDREAKKAGVTWFRPASTLAAAACAAAAAAAASDTDHNPAGASSRVVADNSTAVATVKRDGSPAPRCSASSDNAPPSLLDTNTNGQCDRGEGEVGMAAVRRMPMRRRDGSLALVQWMPYETHECELLTPPNTTLGVCFCGASLVTLPSQPHNDYSAVNEQGAVEHVDDAQTPPLLPQSAPVFTVAAAPMAAVFFDTETPPLPTVLATVTSGKRPSSTDLSPMSSNTSGLHLSSSAATSTPSTTVDSFSYCPMHSVFRPPSIYITRHEEESRDSAVPRSQEVVQGTASRRAEVPSSAVTSRCPFTKPLPPLPFSRPAASSAPSRGSVSNCSCSSNGAGGGHDGASCSNCSGAIRAIIGIGVPHGKQLAKKALEDNNLFFQALRRRQKANAPRAEAINHAQP